MDVVDRVQKLIKKGHALLANQLTGAFARIVESGPMSGWRSQCLNFLERTLPTSSAYLIGFRESVTDETVISVEAGINILESVKEDLEAGDLSTDERSEDPFQLVNNIFERFHQIARQLRSRHDNRDTLCVKDEYDVQDLMHALLYLHFDDIRPEELTPSYTGKSSRMDFLLKQERIVIEIKKTRVGLGGKELGTQLIDDIARYETHPDCDTLVCFVYDPEGLIPNPRGIEDDLRKTEGNMKVEVWIRPR